MNRTSYAGEKFDGVEAVAWEPALLPLVNRGTKEPMPTETVDKVLLADNSEIYVCTVGDCRYFGATTQAITISHRPKEHREELKEWSNRPSGVKQRYDLGELAEMPFGKVIELAQTASKDNGRLSTQNEAWRIRALNAEAELRAVRAAINVLGIAPARD